MPLTNNGIFTDRTRKDSKEKQGPNFPVANNHIAQLIEIQKTMELQKSIQVQM